MWTLDHILRYGKCCPHPHQPSLSQARVWLLLVVLAMDAWRSLLKPNMVLNQIYKCLGVLWKTHMQAALAKPDSVYVYVWVCVCVCEWVRLTKRERKMCVLFVCALLCVCVCVSFLAPIPPVRQRFNKQHTRIKGTSLYTHTQAVSSYCSVHILCTRS